MGMASKEVARELGFEDDKAINGGPRSRLAKLAETAEPLKQIQCFEALGGRANDA